MRIVNTLAMLILLFCCGGCLHTSNAASKQTRELLLKKTVYADLFEAQGKKFYGKTVYLVEDESTVQWLNAELANLKVSFAVAASKMGRLPNLRIGTVSTAGADKVSVNGMWYLAQLSAASYKYVLKWDGKSWTVCSRKMLTIS